MVYNLRELYELYLQYPYNWLFNSTSIQDHPFKWLSAEVKDLSYNIFPPEKTDRVPGWGDDWSRNRSGLLGQTGGRDGRPGYLRLRCATLARRRWQYSVPRPASESCTLALDSVTGGRHIFIYTLSRTQDHGTGTHWATRWDSAAILFNYVGKTNDPRNAPGPGYICHVTRINTNNNFWEKIVLSSMTMPIQWWK